MCCSSSPIPFAAQFPPLKHIVVAIFLLQQHHPTGAAVSLRADPAGAVENKVQWNLKTYLIWSNFVDLSTSLYEIATEEKHIGFGLACSCAFVCENQPKLSVKHISCCFWIDPLQPTAGISKGQPGGNRGCEPSQSGSQPGSKRFCAVERRWEQIERTLIPRFTWFSKKWV